MKRNTVYLVGYDCSVVEVFENKKEAKRFIEEKNKVAKYKQWEMIGRPFNKKKDLNV